MNKEQLNDILMGYLNGNLSPESKALIDQWYAQYEEEGGFVATLAGGEKEVLRKKIFEAILEKAGATAKQLPEPVPTKGRSLITWLKYGLSAAAVILLALGWYFLNYSGAEKSRMNLVRNNTAQLLRQLLPDSSVVWLSPGATLSYPLAFESQSRSVEMNGDCFFEVTKNPRRPFVIVSSRLVTKVWGTSFRVYDVKDRSEARVTVVSGKVSVGKKETLNPKQYTHITKQELILFPKQEAVYKSKASSLEANVQANMRPLQRWSHASMKFDNAAFADIIAELVVCFGTDIRFDEQEFRDTRMTADLSGLNLPEVMDVLKASLSIKYNIYDDHLTISR